MSFSRLQLHDLPVRERLQRFVRADDDSIVLTELAAACITREIGFESLDAIAGGETAGIPFAAWISEALALPMLYVRKQPKGFGRHAQIEGHLHENERVLLVEDLASDGASKVNFCQALRNADAVVGHTFVVFFYSVFPGALKTLLLDKGPRAVALGSHP